MQSWNVTTLTDFIDAPLDGEKRAGYFTSAVPILGITHTVSSDDQHCMKRRTSHRVHLAKLSLRGSRHYQKDATHMIHISSLNNSDAAISEAYSTRHAVGLRKVSKLTIPDFPPFEGGRFSDIRFSTPANSHRFHVACQTGSGLPVVRA
jgi:hypothetical protein